VSEPKTLTATQYRHFWRDIVLREEIMPTVEELGKSLLGTLNQILTGGDARVPAPVNNKIS